MCQKIYKRGYVRFEAAPRIKMITLSSKGNHGEKYDKKDKGKGKDM